MPNIVPYGPGIDEMPAMRCPERMKKNNKELQCLLYKGHFGVHRFEYEKP